MPGVDTRTTLATAAGNPPLCPAANHRACITAGELWAKAMHPCRTQLLWGARVLGHAVAGALDDCNPTPPRGRERCGIKLDLRIRNETKSYGHSEIFHVCSYS